MKWTARVFDDNDNGEPKDVIVDGEFRNHKDVKEYLKNIHKEYRFIYAVPV